MTLSIPLSSRGPFGRSAALYVGVVFALVGVSVASAIAWAAEPCRPLDRLMGGSTCAARYAVNDVNADWLSGMAVSPDGESLHLVGVMRIAGQWQAGRMTVALDSGAEVARHPLPMPPPATEAFMTAHLQTAPDHSKMGLICRYALPCTAEGNHGLMLDGTTGDIIGTTPALDPFRDDLFASQDIVQSLGDVIGLPGTDRRMVHDRDAATVRLEEPGGSVIKAMAQTDTTAPLISSPGTDHRLIADGLGRRMALVSTPYSGEGASHVTIWDIETGDLLIQHPLTFLPMGWPDPVWSPDADQLVMAEAGPVDGIRIRVLDVPHAD